MSVLGSLAANSPWIQFDQLMQQLPDAAGGAATHSTSSAADGVVHVPTATGLGQHLAIITLAVDDLVGARRFYCDVFGWSPIAPASADEAASICFFQLNGFQLALYPRAKMANEHSAPIGSPAGFTLACVHRVATVRRHELEQPEPLPSW